MYTEFYGLKEKPFNLTPSPRFIYMSEGHKEAMALLTYGVTERKGFLLLTGEVGTGKTTMIHNLIDNLDNSVEYVYLVNPLLSPQEFIDYLAFSSFKKRIHFKSKTDFLLEFEEFLKTCLQQQKIFILIIDEAHKLSFELLEEIRLLSNMEYAEEKLISIFLVGQPEINENLNNPKGRATLQRIGIRYDIPPLGLKETGEYIRTRLMVAGATKKDDIFHKEAIEAIYRFSQGYPRTINILADNAMLLGYSSNKRIITSSMVEESYNAMRLDGSFLKNIEPEKPIEKVATVPDLRSRRPLKLILASSLILVIAVLIAFMIKTSRISIPDLSGLINNRKSEDATPSSRSPSKNQTEKNDEAAVDYLEDVNNIRRNIQKEQDVTSSSAAVEDAMQPMELKNLQIFPIEMDTGFSKSIHAKKGDNLTRLGEKVYGYVGEEELALLKRFNPEIINVDQIEVGQKISFPVFTILIMSYDSHKKADSLYQQLKKNGFDANIISSEADGKVTTYQVTVGAFKNRKDAETFASNNLEGRRFNMP